MNTGQNIRFLRRNPPNVGLDTIRQLLDERYGLSGNLSGLAGEKDQNLQLRADSGDKEFVVKVCNKLETQETVGFQLGALAHIADVAPGLPVPRVIADVDSKMINIVNGADDDTHCVYVLSYLPGEVLGAAEREPETYAALGQMIAQLDIALRAYIHPAADQDHPWSLHRSLRFADLTHLIKDRRVRNQVDETFALLKVRWPELQRLRHQVVHQDAHANNTLVCSDSRVRVAGVIDFSDMTWGTLPTELAIACKGVSMQSADPLVSMSEIVRGFDAVLPLEEAEVDAIYDMICARQALSVTIASARLTWFPEEENSLEHVQQPAQHLDALLSVGGDTMRNAFRSACRFPKRFSASRGDSEDKLISLRKQFLGETCKHFYERPLHFERAKGAVLYGSDGNAYLDTYNNVPQVGHCHPHVVRAISRQAATLNTNTRYLYSSAIEYAERLTERLAPHLDTCLFVNSGSEANDVAWQMAQMITGRSGGILMEDGYHGITSPMREFSPGHPSVALADHLRGLIVPDPYRGRFRNDDDNEDSDLAEKYAADADRAVAELQQSGHEIAAFMIDSAFCSSGIPAVPDNYLRGVERRVRDAGGLMICDEVQSGFGRMGQWWGHEHHGVKADIVTMGKPVGNGHPLGVVVTSRAILNEFNAANPLFSTFGGNTVACAAGNAVLDVIEREELIARGNVVGEYFRERLRNLADSQPLIGDVRGNGMLIGLEFVSDRESRTPASKEVARLIELMLQNGVLVGSAGKQRSVLKLRPCMVIQERQVDQFIQALDSSLAALQISPPKN